MCAGERLRDTSGFHSAHLLVVGQSRQIFDVSAVDAQAPDATDEKLTVARPQMPRKSGRIVHGADKEKRS